MKMSDGFQSIEKNKREDLLFLHSPVKEGFVCNIPFSVEINLKICSKKGHIGPKPRRKTVLKRPIFVFSCKDLLTVFQCWVG